MPVDPADFTVRWDDIARNGTQGVTVTHDPTGRSVFMRASAATVSGWATPQERNQWLKAEASKAIDRQIEKTTPLYKREQLIEQAKQHRDNVYAAIEFIDRLAALYPAQASRLPTLAVTYEGEE